MPEPEDYWAQFILLAEQFTGRKSLVEEQKKNSTSPVEPLTVLCLRKILKMAIDVENLEIIQYCVTLGIPLDEDSIDGTTPLLMCIDADSPRLVEKIIELGADVNFKSKKADSPLHYCVDNQKFKAAETLLRLGESRGLNLNSLGNDGLSPIHRAAKLYETDMIKLLAHYGADTNIKDPNGLTPLHHAALCSSSS